MRHLVCFLRQRLVVVLACGIGIERQVELILPAEIEAGATKFDLTPAGLKELLSAKVTNRVITAMRERK